MELRADWGSQRVCRQAVPLAAVTPVADFALAFRPLSKTARRTMGRLNAEPQARVGEIGADIFRMSSRVSEITEHASRHEWDRLPLPGVERQRPSPVSGKWWKVKSSTPG